jgi:SAM-dependent methyltransferase
MCQPLWSAVPSLALAADLLTRAERGETVAMDQTIDQHARRDHADWVRSWDEQQQHYMANREERFDVILDVVAAVTGNGPRAVLDLCCGPGSLAARVLSRFPDASVVALDNDPVLMLLGRRAYGDHGGRLTWIEADLRRRSWTEAVATHAPFDAVVSTTALHWLGSEPLQRVYAGAAGLLAPRGVIANGDHFFEPEHPRLSAVQASLRQSFDGDDDVWRGWWEDLASAAAGDEELAAAFDERARRDAEHPDSTVSPPLADHLDALRVAGFGDAGTVWQFGDDRVLVAMR